jgi:hypothetical protein
MHINTTETLRYSLVGLETKSDFERCELSGKHHESLMTDVL